MPSLSPDGTRIAFASNRSGNWDIWIMPVTGGKAIQISMDSAHELHPRGRPTARSIVFSRLGHQLGPLGALWVSDPYDALSSQHIGYGLFPEWSPVAGTGVNGSDKILFQRSRERGGGPSRSGRWTTTRRPTRRGTRRRSSSDPDLAYINPSFSPDGMWMTLRGRARTPRSGSAAVRTFTPPSASVWMIGWTGGARCR
jgi:TolB protein